ncbi:hypothetical protein O6H91_06G066400 [Diphasiastrum complanatum]|uniref:Uncharacterized protein n=1 Tax=Diphasiastrum complanatum TaxID=34168 RepID=A0ACC2DF49_DIPCM|nr:hypothetical protein O6H91_06G066400 [Diphasiastrum complanatum]
MKRTRLLLQFVTAASHRCYPAMGFTSSEKLLAAGQDSAVLRKASNAHPSLFWCSLKGSSIATSNIPRSYWNFVLSAVASCGLFGALISQPVFNESTIVESGSPTSEGNVDVEKVVHQVREGVRERLKAWKLQGSFIPQLKIGARGQQVVARFTVSPACDVYQLIVEVVSQLSGGGGEEMVVRAWDSAVARQIVISSREPMVNETLSRTEAEEKRTKVPEANPICVMVFEPLIGDKLPEIEFLKKGYFTHQELDALVSSLKVAAGIDSEFQRRKIMRLNKGQANPRRGKRVLDALEKMGVKIYGLESDAGSLDGEQLSWDNIAGYHEQKREIEDTVLLALQRPEVYDSIARGTRHKFESNRPRAVLFEGPPGTGKTSCARVIASQAGVPLLYVPLEVIMSKYYGESERLLASIFSAGNELPDGAIVFLDEIDSLATTRDSEMHEATRRILSVLLRQMDGFEQDKRIIVIAATNRKQDLDPALLSRFDSSITFGLPDQCTREEIVAQYARHLTATDLASIAVVTEGMSGRDLHDICQQAERRWASKLIKGLAGDPPSHGLPPVQEYIESALKRQRSLFQVNIDHGKYPTSLLNTARPPMLATDHKEI